MPLDNSMYPTMQEDMWIPPVPVYIKSFAWLPHRCTQSNCIIWFQWGRRYQQWIGYGDARYSKWIWLTEQEYLILCLKADNE